MRLGWQLFLGRSSHIWVHAQVKRRITENIEAAMAMIQRRTRNAKVQKHTAHPTVTKATTIEYATEITKLPVNNLELRPWHPPHPESRPAEWRSDWGDHAITDGPLPQLLPQGVGEETRNAQLLP